MPLSRLENFLRSVRGNILYVDPNALDSTDSIENDGTSAARPFKTIQRALIEAAQFSYLSGKNNDKFAGTTILLYPGDHLVDNRPGFIPLSATNFRKRDGTDTNDFNEFDLQTNFDVNADNNALYKMNSIYGGVIVPRGTSIVGQDLRKTVIRPKYVPNPENDNIERSAIFRMTGACYFYQLTFLDADPNGQCFKDYTKNKFVPNFSHHKLTAFEYADGANDVSISDTFQTYSTGRTDLEIYYQKIGLAYGDSSGRGIAPDYPSTVDIEPKIDEFRIVGSKGQEVGITSIFAGDSVSPTTTITVTLDNSLEGLDVDTPIRINGVADAGYNGQFVVSEVVSSTSVKYKVSTAPTVASSGSDGTLNIISDTVTSASPYIFNISLRSVYGLCGLHADGSKVKGFKSVVTAQFTGISLQKDNNAFVKYDETTGNYIDSSSVANIYSDSEARYKPNYFSYHIKASNDSVIQAVSIFAIGYAEHFVGESGGDMSITNSNSNFGAHSLVSKGFKSDKFLRDDHGYVTHIIPPKFVENKDNSTEFLSLDTTKTITGVGNSNRLYLYNETNENDPPNHVLDGYRIGAKESDRINLNIAGVNYASRIIMQSDSNVENIYQKEYRISNIPSSGTDITLTEEHDLINGESVRVESESGELPGGISPNRVYYAITDTTKTSLSSSQIRLAITLNDAENGSNDSSAITLYNTTSTNLKIISRVSDKSSGEIGHPIQWDNSQTQWYVGVSSSLFKNAVGPNPTKLIYEGLEDNSSVSVTPRTYIERVPDTRGLEETIYKFRYVIPKDTTLKARPPLDGYVFQKSTYTPSTDTEIDKQYSVDGSAKTLSNIEDLRSTRFISSCTWNSNVVTVNTELPHGLKVGNKVKIVNVKSSNNLSAGFTGGFNGNYSVTDVINRKEFKYALTTNPGIFTDNTSTRTTSLPYFDNKQLNGTYISYRNEQIREYIHNKQDGIYYITVLNSSNSPGVSTFSDYKLLQPVSDLYPQRDRDNLKHDPEPANSFATSSLIGEVISNDRGNSITRETVEEFVSDNRIGFGITDISSDTTHPSERHVFFTDVDHGLNPATKVVITTTGSNYGTGSAETFFNAKLTGGSGEGATAVVKINASGELTNVELMDGGSAYAEDDVLTVTGITTSASHTAGTVTVTKVYNDVQTGIRLTGISDLDYKEYNRLYCITSIVNSKEFIARSSSTITPNHTTGITTVSNGHVQPVGDCIIVDDVYLDESIGIATFTTQSSHGLRVNDNFDFMVSSVDLFSGYQATDSDKYYDYWNRNFTVKEVVSNTEIKVETGKTSFINSKVTSGDDIGKINAFLLTLNRIIPTGFASKGGNNEGRIEGRISSVYGGRHSTLSSQISNNGTTLSITDLVDLGLNIGDYLQVDSEIMRIKSTVDISSDANTDVSVFRGVLGSTQESHSSGSVVKRIYPNPIEFRRNSILRASGHTFEYVGFGPGNYSTALPDRQDRQISDQEELLSQSLKLDGGINVYTGMNNDGDFYIGNKKISSATGQEDVFDSPIPTIKGEESSIENGSLFNAITSDQLTATSSIKVEGGNGNNNVSEFGGPVIFNNKLTSNSDEGIEATSLYLQGNALNSRKYSLSTSDPSISGSYGDVEYFSDPTDGGYAGWVYTTGNAWRKFGPIQNSDGHYVGTFSGTFVGSGSQLSDLDPIWREKGTNTLGTSFYNGSVYIGPETTNPSTPYDESANRHTNMRLRVEGNAKIDGRLEVTEIIEKATIVDDSLSALTTLYLGDNNVYYYTSNSVSDWTINFAGFTANTSGTDIDESKLSNLMALGDTVTVAVLAPNGTTAYKNSAVQIDGTEITPKWFGGTAPTGGNASSIDSYTYVIVRINTTGTLSLDFTVLASQSTFG